MKYQYLMETIILGEGKIWEFQGSYNCYPPYGNIWEIDITNHYCDISWAWWGNITVGNGNPLRGTI